MWRSRAGAAEAEVERLKAIIANNLNDWDATEVFANARIVELEAEVARLTDCLETQYEINRNTARAACEARGDHFDAEVRIAELEASLAEADMWAVDHCEYVAPEAYDALEAKVRELEAGVKTARLAGAEAFADWAAEDNDFPSTDASFEDWKDRGLPRPGSAGARRGAGGGQEGRVMSRAPIGVTPEDLAILRQAMWSTASEPEWNLGMRVLDRLEGKALAPMNVAEARAFMRTLMSPMAVAARRLR